MWELLGSIAGNLISQDAANKRADQQEALQREFAQNGIRWRVADAKAAGVHPLYALGSGVTPYSPVATVGQDWGDTFGKAGQALGRAITAQETVDERQKRDLERRVAESQVDLNSAQAQFWRSQAANPVPAANALPMAGSPWAEAAGAHAAPYRAVEVPEAVELRGDSGDFPGRYNVVKPKPVEIESANPSAPWVMAGPPRPGWQRYRLTQNMSALMPPSDEGWPEGLESLPFSMIPMWLMVNEDATPGFWRLAVQEFGMRSPVARWISRLGMDKFEPRSRMLK